MLASILCFTPGAALGEIIIDDFDDPIQIPLPELENQLVITDEVGPLNAERGIDVSSSQTDPLGRLDVSISRASNLTARIDGQNLDHPQNLPILSFGAGYRFDAPVDLTEGGVNDAMFVDMTIFEGSGFPPALSVLVRDANDLFAAIVPGDGLPSASPYTITLPFSSFGFRGGGGVGLADFSTVTLFELRVRLLQGGRDPEVKRLVQVDRIRVGRFVPEPNPTALLLTATLILGVCRFSCPGSLQRFNLRRITMKSNSRKILILALLLQSSASVGLAIDVTAVTNPNVASTVAANLNGSGSLITINSASFLIYLVAGGSAFE
jgi:hypothetical protein